MMQPTLPLAAALCKGVCCVLVSFEMVIDRYRHSAEVREHDLKPKQQDTICKTLPCCGRQRLNQPQLQLAVSPPALSLAIAANLKGKASPPSGR